MEYRWIPITSGFDRTISFNKVRFTQNLEFGSINCKFSELPNINTDGHTWDQDDGAQYGYAKNNRWCYNADGNKRGYLSNRQIGIDKWWDNVGTLVAGTQNTYEYEYPYYVYWAGTTNVSDYVNLPQICSVYAEVAVFEPSKSAFNFKLTGGTDTFDLTADSNWTATTASDWVSLNQYSGTTGGTISVTCDRNYTETARTATITFTNANSETFNITVNQRKGTTEKEVNKMYRNGGVIFQRQMFSTRLSVSENSLSFPKTGATQNVTVRSNAPYTVSASTDWITISTASTGIAVTVPNYTGTTDRTGTITVTANNAGDIVTKTISISQKLVRYVSYIHKQNIETEMVSNIDTGIYPTTATTFRVVGMHKGFACDMVAGFWNGYDNKDYRLFWTTSPRVYFDWNSSRIEENHSSVVAESTIDFTGYNYGIKDSNGTVIITGIPLTHMEETGVTFKVNVGAWWLKKLQIWQGETLVFDGEAAIEDEHIGLYDSVSGQLKYNPDLTMGYEE